MPKKKPPADAAQPEPGEKPSNPWPVTLKALRARQHLTIAQAAAKVGVTPRAWIAWEQEERRPSSSLVILLRLLEQHPELFEKSADSP